MKFSFCFFLLEAELTWGDDKEEKKERRTELKKSLKQKEKKKNIN